MQKLPPAKLIPPAGFGGRPSRLSQEVDQLLQMKEFDGFECAGQDLGRMPGDHAEVA